MARTAERLQKSQRIEMRVTPEEDELLGSAADLAHVSKTAFILSAAAERATQILREVHSYPVSPEVFQRFLDELDRPAVPIPAMVDMFKRAAK